MNPLRTVTWSVPLLVGILIVVLGAGWPSGAVGGVIFNDPQLPPESDPPDCNSLISVCMAEGLYAAYPGPICMYDPVHKCFENVYRQDIGSDEQQTFDSVWGGRIDMGYGPVPVTLTGPVTTIAYNKAGNTTGLFDTEIVSMSLSGSVGAQEIEIRESPTEASTGEVDIVDLGGGLYQIDSFFDIYTELSVEGGEWMPQTCQAQRIYLVSASMISVQHTTWGAIKSLFE